MYVQIGRGPANGGDGAQIGDNDRVRAQRLQHPRVVAQRVDLRIGGEGVDRDVQPAVQRVGFADGLGEIVHGKAHAARAQLHLRPADVHRVRAEAQRRAQALQIARRGEQLQLIHV